MSSKNMSAMYCQVFVYHTSLHTFFQLRGNFFQLRSLVQRLLQTLPQCAESDDNGKHPVSIRYTVSQ